VSQATPLRVYTITHRCKMQRATERPAVSGHQALPWPCTQNLSGRTRAYQEACTYFPSSLPQTKLMHQCSQSAPPRNMSTQIPYVFTRSCLCGPTAYAAPQGDQNNWISHARAQRPCFSEGVSNNHASFKMQSETTGSTEHEIRGRYTLRLASLQSPIEAPLQCYPPRPQPRQCCLLR
jgi:hypothetical protein